MDRRTFIGRTIGFGTLALAGCLGSEEDRFTLRVADLDFGENENGYLEARITVSNVGNEHERGTLYVTSELNEDSIVRVREVSLDAHQTREYTITYDVKMANVTSYSLEADVEPVED